MFPIHKKSYLTKTIAEITSKLAWLLDINTGPVLCGECQVPKAWACAYIPLTLFIATALTFPIRDVESSSSVGARPALALV